MRLPWREALLAIAPDGFDKLDLICSVEIALDLAVTLLDWTKVAALLKVVHMLLGHAGAACQYLCHRVELAQDIIIAQGGPHLSLCLCLCLCLCGTEYTSLFAPRQEVRGKNSRPLSDAANCVLPSRRELRRGQDAG